MSFFRDIWLLSSQWYMIQTRHNQDKKRTFLLFLIVNPLGLYTVTITKSQSLLRNITALIDIYCKNSLNNPSILSAPTNKLQITLKSLLVSTSLLSLNHPLVPAYVLISRNHCRIYMHFKFASEANLNHYRFTNNAN